jgi:hypothetical protein
VSLTSSEPLTTSVTALPSCLHRPHRRASLLPAFPALTARYPLYGACETPPLTADWWWTLLIEQTMLAAGADEAGSSPSLSSSPPASADPHSPFHLPPQLPDVARALSTLGPRLLTRFASKEGYAAFSDARGALERLAEMGVKTAVLSNADDRICTFSLSKGLARSSAVNASDRAEFPPCVRNPLPVRVLDSLDLTPLLSSPPTLSHLEKIAKPDRAIFELACVRAGVDVDEALMIGDELEACVPCSFSSCPACDTLGAALILRSVGSGSMHRTTMKSG